MRCTEHCAGILPATAHIEENSPKVYATKPKQRNRETGKERFGGRKGEKSLKSRFQPVKMNKITKMALMLEGVLADR